MNQKILLVLPWLLLATLLPALSFAATEPSAAPAPSVTGPLATNYFDLEVNYTKPADAEGVLVVARQAYTPIEAPVDTTVYIANARLGVGDTIVAGCFLYCDYVVADAAASGSVTVTGLKDGTKYYFAAYSYNGSGTDINYNRTINAIFATTPTVPVAGRSHNEMWVADSSPKDGVNWGTMTSADCAKCHGVHHTSQLLPSGQDQLNKCQSCHRAGGPASAKTDIGLHPADDSVDCGTCHSMHSFRKEELYSTNHAGGKGFNKSFVRANMSKYMNPTDYPPPGGGGSITGLDNTVFQNRPADFAFASADPVSGKFNGPCQSCHKDPDVKHHTQTGTDGHQIGQDCIVCHKHSDKFLHGGGSGTGCVECHGHDAGTFFDSDMTAPYTAGSIASPGRGTVQSHSTHTEIVGDDLKGPGIYCDSCHDINNFPNFKDDIATYDTDGDGRVSLDETQVCDGCHSEGGSYAGLTDPVVGAKEIWKSGAYVATDDSTLRSGKEQWCATCHDDAPSQINGVTAPNVIGDEDGETPYGFDAGYGYYKTGHGLPPNQNYPSSGGWTRGAGMDCQACHDYSMGHVDGNARTYNRLAADGDADDYQHGYRLKLVDGQLPLNIPLSWNENQPSDYRLCVKCHNPEPLLNASNMNTNYRDDNRGTNAHAYHLNSVNQWKWFSDWDVAAPPANGDSDITCVSCHNVHGSTQLAMVRDGKLEGAVILEPGTPVLYRNDTTALPNPLGCPGDPLPRDMGLAQSNGTLFKGSESHENTCRGCHAGTGSCGWTNGYSPYMRVPVNFSAINDADGDGVMDNVDLCPAVADPLQADGDGDGIGDACDFLNIPELAWAGGTDYTGDGVAPDSAIEGSSFTFRVKYRDALNLFPTSIRVWIDLDDSGSIQSGEWFDLSEADAGDTDCSDSDGKLYERTVNLDFRGDGYLLYRFEATNGQQYAPDLPAPPDTRTVRVLSHAPWFEWVNDWPNFQNDGVDPDVGLAGASFLFRIKYFDYDGQAPDGDGVRVLIDGTYTTLDPESGGSYATGKIYSKAITLNTVGDLNYRFTAKDSGGASATGAPTTNHVVTVLASTNTAPVLEWASAPCLTEGVRPRTGAKNTDFEFQVKYIDPDIDDCPPAAIAVTVNGTTTPLTTHDGGSCQTGRIYSAWIPIATVGDLNYSFSASDGLDAATGTPTSNHVVSVINTTFKVRPSGDPGWGGSGWYNTIAATIAPSGEYSTTLVYPDSSTMSATYTGYLDFFNRNNRKVQSVCGPEQTAISYSTTRIRSGNNLELDGFTITDGTSAYGINIAGGHAVTVKNSIFTGNSGGNGTAIYCPTGCSLTVDRTAFTGNSGGAGAALYIAGAGTSNLSNIFVTGNYASNNGALYLNSTVNIVNATISGNNSLDGGGIYLAGGTTKIKNSIIWGNNARNTANEQIRSAGSLTVSYSDIQGGVWAGNGNQSSVPGFINPQAYGDAPTAAGDYGLQAGAFAIDKGTSSTADGLTVPPDDYEGDPRPWPAGGGIDMGADEYVP